MAASDLLEREILEYVMRSGQVAATFEVALYIDDPTDAGTGTEVSAASYARAAVPSDATSWVAPATEAGVTTTSNASQIDFPDAAESWGTITHYGIHDAVTGSLLIGAPLDQSYAISSGQPVFFRASELIVSAE